MPTREPVPTGIPYREYYTDIGQAVNQGEISINSNPEQLRDEFREHTAQQRAAGRNLTSNERRAGRVFQSQTNTYDEAYVLRGLGTVPTGCADMFAPRIGA